MSEELRRPVRNRRRARFDYGPPSRGLTAPPVTPLNSGVPGLPEHAHPVATQDFRDVDRRIAPAQQFRAEDWEVLYLIEILDVLECARIP